MPTTPDLWVLQGDLLRAGRRPAAEAEAAYRKAIDLQPDQLEAHAALIGLAVQRKDMGQASQQVQQMLKASKGNAQARYLEASVALMQGDAKHAREVTQGLLRVAPNHPRVLFVAGLAELRLGAPALAETLLTKSVMADADAAEPRRALAEALLRLGRAPRALDVLAPLTGAQSRDAKAVALLAQAHLLQGDTRQADEAFARAAQLAPSDADVRTARAVSQLGRGKDDAALAELGDLARTQADATADYALVTTHLRRGDFKQALAAADALAAKLPQQPMPDMLRGQIALRLNDRDAARRYFEWALGKDARYLPALNQLVALDLADGKPDLARGRLVAHLQKHADHVPAMLALADLLRRTGAPREEAQKWLDEAVKVNPIDPAARMAVVDHHLRSNDSRAALQAAQAADTAIRDNPELVERLGRAQLRAGELNQAVATFRRLLAMRPGNPAPLLLLAQAQEAAGEAAAARQQIDEAIRLAPDAVPPRQAAVALALRQNEPARALDLARAVQQRAPRDALGWALEGDVEMARQRWPAATAAYREALKRQRPVDVPVRLHAALLRSGKADEAAAFEQSWRKAQPGDLGFVLRLADAAMARGDRAGAEKRYRDVLAQRPEDPWALNNLAQMLVDQRKPGALDLARRAVAAAPDRADVRDTMAQAYAVADQLEKAVQTQLEAVALAPEAPSLRLNLVRLYLRTGDKDKALEEITWLKRQPAQIVRPEVVRDLERQVAGQVDGRPRWPGRARPPPGELPAPTFVRALEGPRVRHAGGRACMPQPTPCLTCSWGPKAGVNGVGLAPRKAGNIATPGADPKLLSLPSLPQPAQDIDMGRLTIRRQQIDEAIRLAPTPYRSTEEEAVAAGPRAERAGRGRKTWRPGSAQRGRAGALGWALVVALEAAQTTAEALGSGRHTPAYNREMLKLQRSEWDPKTAACQPAQRQGVRRGCASGFRAIVAQGPARANRASCCAWRTPPEPAATWSVPERYRDGRRRAHARIISARKADAAGPAPFIDRRPCAGTRLQRGTKEPDRGAARSR
ncbi:MAG: PEP-CTERM system TPR-repeat protein PrsT [Rubrivivax sp.]|nr:PEP-CTERM system TPR-repeat protein PrsT [Rubrivivax sp.]